MRQIFRGLAASCLLAALAGCNTFPLFRNTGAQPVARVPQSVPSKESLVDYLNDNARRIQSVRCKDLDVTVKQGFQTFGLHGQLACQKPRNFRMGASVLGSPEVDLGSNDQEFWFWIKRGDPYLFYCSYDDLAQGRLPASFPFQPEWIMEAIGIAECSAPENYELKVNPTTLELIENVRSPHGAPMRKVTVMNRGEVRPPQPQVLSRSLIDSRGQELIAAHITEVRIDQATGAIIPRKIRIVTPGEKAGEKTELRLQLDNVSVNDPTLVQATRLFTRPNLTGVTSFDLARRAPDVGPSGVRPIGAQQVQ